MNNNVLIVGDSSSGVTDQVKLKVTFDTLAFETAMKKFVHGINNLFKQFIICKSCPRNFRLPPSGERWANKLRKRGWRRYGSYWYCPECSSNKNQHN